ncbi:DUF669 domain-containing protein [Streptococcus agalactiae]|uniref:DUF669 domain-containing protein n=1 Tax=Streptococcus agalactiae TaxID=1311 RepID=UPI000F5FC934|nr:DUF669 domain-containing protein [Streptococcus agalactiae]MCC9673982.1 DUF669 domain-containing protein [Streptococcus agalactiae]MCC9713205.1 DUF669 domain-containing protein [Streptococcus agalactiae]MCC9743522.1 DUF669 domain-containing protein [Streptococcus agalactiae]MCC9747894.1 DUF669 domain-containing protein [Streptococcus agalactiae]RRA61830.1 DUF669 domain-containing protein [Streptococcus agalactiae]
MTGFTTDFSEVKEHAEFKEQPYEMIVYDAYEAVNDRNGKKRVVIDYVVRNDIKQEMQNYHLWDEQYPNSQTGKYHIGILMGKAKALGIKEGQHYDSFEAFLNDFKGRTAKVTVKLDEYNGNKYPKVRYANQSEVPNSQHVWKEKTTGFTQAEIKEDDLPF